jgi:hypothetical protein
VRTASASSMHEYVQQQRGYVYHPDIRICMATAALHVASYSLFRTCNVHPMHCNGWTGGAIGVQLGTAHVA